MSGQDPWYDWTKELTKTFADSSKPQVKGLAGWSFGMTLARCCSLDCVASHLADWLEQPGLTARSRLPQWYLPAERKSISVCGDKRTELPAHMCLAPLLRWPQRDWPVPRLALALDASTLGDRFVLLAVSVLHRRCAIPVAWKILPATAKGAWKPHWLELLHAMRGVAPADWLVVALTDRGLWASWLFHEIQLVAGIRLCVSTWVDASGPTARGPLSRANRWCQWKERVGAAQARRFRRRGGSWRARCWAGGGVGTRSRG
jgi:hypothetical protein